MFLFLLSGEINFIWVIIICYSVSSFSNVMKIEKELTNRKKNSLIFGILGLSSVFTLD